MGPLVPYIISEEFSLVIAFFLGIAFGFILEQAGFSSTKKLVGLFYGYDFTVLRVFFTAGITALAGVLLFGHYGLLDLDIIYINPTFLKSAIFGGLIMGAGFIIGGFCPGTSVCALAIGKLDAMAFVGGSILGVWGFIEAFPLVENLYNANNMGMIRLSDYLGISNVSLGLIITLIALMAFAATWIIENRVNKREMAIDPKLKTRYLSAAFAILAVYGVLAFMPGRIDLINMRIAEARRQAECVFKEIPADKLAEEIVSNYYLMNIIDVRSPEEYEKYHLPLAINIPFDDLLQRQYEPLFRQNIKKNVFYADNDTIVKMACLKARFIGNSENMIMRETAHQFREMFFEAKTPPAGATKNDFSEYLFRTSMARKMSDLVDALKNIGAPVKREPIKVKGGC